MRKIGYIRVSSTSQNPSRQFQQLNEIGMDIIFEEKVSGAAKDREQLQKMLEDLQEGDIIYATDLTRITRSTQNLFELIDLIRRKKASLKSLKDTWLDLSEDNPYSQFLITVMAGVNQLERDLIRMRQREGIELAKKEGKFKGRLKKYHKNHAGMKYAVKLYKEGGMTVNQICEITNVSRASLYRRLSEGNK
ncbi:MULTISPECIES: recombinase family protein [Listeria]|uniref:recombinase family protein n=1 Tax=Listeria TaxID=1637 RepID=UPI0008694024|nr:MULTISPECIES: recombinase family protein [Listeria]EAD2781182.1 recombinase family protein [Listeria monocytogenes]EAD4818785.1 recombinase family protein [Listeria monocytogenes]EAD5706097.1 recombinase family protein [Listeria innocua]EAE2608953.1 recombinase family protein [Listeria monocytogenes]EAE4446687.1 recombinase family protein [Listeria monocytogenes]